MRLSESLRRGVLEAVVGGIVNKFKIRSKRRDTLFFEELLARYILECEKAGFERETMKMGEEWGYLVYKTLILEAIKKIPPVFQFNTIVKTIWVNLGLVDDVRIEKDDNIIRMIAKREAITRYISKNNLAAGFYIGTFEALFNYSIQPLDIEQSKESSTYTFKLQKTPIVIYGRPKEIYKRLNEIVPIKGYTLNDALKRKTFTLSANKLYFRTKQITPMENTIVHIIGKFNLVPEKMTTTAHNFFKELVSKKSNNTEKISLFKTLFQMMGWGIINIVVNTENEIVIEIKNQPHSLLLEDNYNYIAKMFLGYMWLINEKLKISAIKKTDAHLSISLRSN